MPGRQRKDRSRRRFASIVGVAALVTAVSPIYLATPAQAAGSIPSNFYTVTDPDGVNDGGGNPNDQGDLTQMGRDDSDPNQLQLFWSWDNTDWSGGNRGDACALFDSNDNGNIDFAVCAEIEAGSGATVVQASGSPSSWTCDDSKNDRCAGPTSATNGATAGTLSTFDTSSTADLVTDTDPFGSGSDSPNDSTIQVHIPNASLPSGATLVEVCSFPSIGSGGNPAPIDCLTDPGTGSLVIHKSTFNDNTNNPPTFPFTINPGGTTVDVDADTTSAPQPLVAGSGYSISETVPPNWFFDSAYCSVENSLSSTGTQTATGMKDITVVAGKTTRCDVYDTPQSDDLSLTKTPSPSVFTSAGQTITYTLTATNVSSQDTLTDVVITDPMLGGDLTDCTDGGGNPVAPPVTLDPGDVLKCSGTYQTTQSDVTAGRVDNTAVAHGNVFEEVPVYRSATATVNLFVPPPPPPPPPAGSPTLGVTKSSVPPSGSVVQPGDQVVYTLSYGNTGTAAATSVTLSDTLPADLDYVTGSASNAGAYAYDATTRTLTWSLGTVPAGTSGSVTFTAQVAQTATAGELLHNVGVITAPGISDPSNNDDVTVTLPPPTGTVTISKAVDKSVAEFGDTLTYTVTVGATGNKDQTHVVASDTVPDLTSYVDGSAACDAPCTASEGDGVVTWDIGTLAPGESTDVTFQVTIDTPEPDASGGLPAERIDNSATVNFDADPTEVSNTVHTDVAAVLGEKVTKPPHVTPKPVPQPDVLPFTGPLLPLSLLQLLTMATVAIAGGSLMVRRARTRIGVAPVALVEWRDQ